MNMGKDRGHHEQQDIYKLTISGIYSWFGSLQGPSTNGCGRYGWISTAKNVTVRSSDQVKLGKKPFKLIGIHFLRRNLRLA